MRTRSPDILIPLQRLCRRLILLAAVVESTSALAAPGDLLFKITAPDPQPGASFGYELATIDGDLLVGEITRNLGPDIDAQGRAYLFDGQSGKLKHTFDIPEPMPGDIFGSSLAGGDGARGSPQRVYAFDTKTGKHLHTIERPSQFHNGFGAAIAYGNGSVLVSAPTFSIPFGLQHIGQTELFDAATGEFSNTLPNPEPKSADGFGVSLAMYGERAVVGAYLDDLPSDVRPDGDNPGRVWIFDRSTGETVLTLENPNPEKQPPFFISDSFAETVSANDKFIVVGADGEDVNGVIDSGAAYVFDSNTGELLHTLLSPALEENANFGRSRADARRSCACRRFKRKCQWAPSPWSRISLRWAVGQLVAGYPQSRA